MMTGYKPDGYNLGAKMWNIVYKDSSHKTKKQNKKINRDLCVIYIV